MLGRKVLGLDCTLKSIPWVYLKWADDLRKSILFLRRWEFSIKSERRGKDRSRARLALWRRKRGMAVWQIRGQEASFGFGPHLESFNWVSPFAEFSMRCRLGSAAPSLLYLNFSLFAKPNGYFSVFLLLAFSAISCYYHALLQLFPLIFTCLHSIGWMVYLFLLELCLLSLLCGLLSLTHPLFSQGFIFISFSHSTRHQAHPWSLKDL